MLVLCNGMPRSASTWSFNVVMQLFRRLRPEEQVHGGFDENITHFIESTPLTASHVVLKCHTLDAVGRVLARTGAAQIVYTWRNPADAVASFMAMFDVAFEHALAVIRTSLRLLRFHQETGNVVVLEYGEIVADPAAAIQRIAEYLGLCAGPEQIGKIAEETSFERMREKVEQLNSGPQETRLVRVENIVYDPNTLLNLDHIRDGSSGYGSKSLTQHQLTRIDELLEEFHLSRDRV